MKISPAVEAVLRILQAGTETSVNILAAFTPIESYRTLRRERARPKSFFFKTDWALAYRDRQKFHRLLNRLKEQGLIERRTEHWSITGKGRDRLHIISERNRWGTTKATYAETGKDTTLKIIAYDIPSNSDGHRQRAWLRSVLRNLGFQMLQKSLWVGKRKVPEAFMHELRERDLIPAVQVFSVGVSGTLREVE